MKLRLDRKNTIGLIFFLAFVISMSLIFQFEERFTIENWKSNYTTRYKMVDDLIESQFLIGKPKSEVFEILGQPDSQSNAKKDAFIYDIGDPPSFFSSQKEYLLIIFKNEQVEEVTLAVD